jgi:PPOX class probable F420-dependent enzyme
VSADRLNEAALEFVTARHLATLTTLLPDGFPHVVPVGFTFEPTSDAQAASGSVGTAGTVRIITNGPSQKVLNARRDPRASVCQVEGANWITLAGTARILDDPAEVADAVERYAARYRQPRENPQRVVIAIEVERVMMSGLLSA